MKLFLTIAILLISQQAIAGHVVGLVSWGSVENADQYHVLIYGKNQQPEDNKFNPYTVTGTSKTFNKLAHGTTYCVQVISSDSTGQYLDGPPSDEVCLTTPAPTDALGQVEWVTFTIK